MEVMPTNEEQYRPPDRIAGTCGWMPKRDNWLEVMVWIMRRRKRMANLKKRMKSRKKRKGWYKNNLTNPLTRDKTE